MSFVEIYRKYFGDATFLFDSASSRKTTMRLPHAVPTYINLVDTRFDIGSIHVKTGRLLSSITGEDVICLFDAGRNAASEMLSAITGRAIDLERLFDDLDSCALDVLRNAIDLECFDLSPISHRANLLGPSSVKATWSKGNPPLQFRPPIIEFRGASTWVVSDGMTLSRLLLDPFGAISRTTARDIIIDVGRA